MARATAPAKLILCGEHAVVYGRPAIAVPLSAVRAWAEVSPGAPGAGMRLRAPDLGEAWDAATSPDNPLCELALAVAERLDRPGADLTITLGSAIPVASGMGSGAAIGTALVRAMAEHIGVALSAAEVAELVYTSERRFHGTPSGIDNAVVAHERAVWFVKAPPGAAPNAPAAPTLEPVAVGAPLSLVIGDSGVRSATKLPVGAVRAAWQADPARYEAIFDAVGDLVTRARAALGVGTAEVLGHLLDANQALLEGMGVSSPELEGLVLAARRAGALGAKLSGAGWGGVMFALVTPETGAAVAEALRDAGATRVLETTLAAP